MAVFQAGGFRNRLVENEWEPVATRIMLSQVKAACVELGLPDAENFVQHTYDKLKADGVEDVSVKISSVVFRVLFKKRLAEESAKAGITVEEFTYRNLVSDLLPNMRFIRGDSRLVEWMVIDGDETQKMQFMLDADSNCRGHIQRQQPGFLGISVMQCIGATDETDRRFVAEIIPAEYAALRQQVINCVPAEPDEAHVAETCG